MHHACMWLLQQQSLARGHADTVQRGFKQQEHAGHKACPPIPGPACQLAQTVTSRGQLAGRHTGASLRELTKPAGPN